MDDVPTMNVRENILFGEYCRMAMESYYQAFQLYQKIEEAGYTWFSTDEVRQMDREVISTVVFSAMSLESFFNNYIASYCGDEKFYGVYDSLSPTSKFCLIVEFIWHGKVDKSKAYYGGLINLFRLRNNYVHNKSKKSKFQGYTYEEYVQIEESRSENNSSLDKMSTDDKKRVKDSIREASDALKAVCEVARFFDQHDSNVHAMIFLFGEYNFRCANTYDEKPMELVFQQLGIKKNFK